MAVLLECQGVSYDYPGRGAALRDVHLEIVKGRKTAIIGPNGAGKSTLFLHLNGVLRPKGGQVRFQGEPIVYRNKDLSLLRKEVAVILQNPDDQIFSATVEEDVAFGPLNLGLPKEEIEARVDEALALVDMTGERERPSQQLSFGQKKRLALAGALAMRPKVLIMDEPTAGLDPHMVQEVLELTEELHMKGITLVMSTHELEVAYSWADDFVVMNLGKVVFSGPAEGLFANRSLLELIGFQAPDVYRMNEEMHRIGLFELTPVPKHMTDLRMKFCRMNGRAMGGMSIRRVDKGELPSITEVHTLISQGRAVGYYGSRAKHLLATMLPSDVRLPGLRGCLDKMVDGRDAMLYTDGMLVPAIMDHINNLAQRYGLAINVMDGWTEEGHAADGWPTG
ncbi:MAG TPA: ABC transporter ATP-binding protein [Methanomassiliicoccales archaeon]|nr:energy-coupling factor ABC transporter ATP-binding protein [Euryarchaeota archaeon]HOE52137.1 ABC transporter ATP-binding protein [Methanomassiliicoccales archaeon]HOO04531.1 ABC transporter ATP-binding protein [Methanomassiliicoccales archaeon]HQM67402.1 ABC transporter ATP-binding protein [Methanomassiliicoccales archaeon]